MLHHGPAEVAADEVQLQLVALEVLDDLVHQVHHPVGKVGGGHLAAGGVTLSQNAGAQPVHQLLGQVVLIFKVGIKRAFGHLGLLHNVVNGGFGLALAHKQAVGGIQKVLLPVFPLGGGLFGHTTALLSLFGEKAPRGTENTRPGGRISCQKAGWDGCSARQDSAHFAVRCSKYRRFKGDLQGRIAQLIKND